VKEDYGGQRRNMEDVSMVGTLASQAAVIWPKEREVLKRRAGKLAGRILDVCCGTGEIVRRLREEGGGAFVTGVDLFRGHLRHADLPVVQGNAYRLPFGDGTFDLVLVRHVLQALPAPLPLMREARRVLKRGGRVHLLVEDYAAILFDVDDRDSRDLFLDVAPRFVPRGTDLLHGRKAYRQLREAGFRDVTVDPITVDNLGADRETFAAIFRFWRDGYAELLGGILGVGEAEARRRFDGLIRAALDPERYCNWVVLAMEGVAP